MFKFLPAIFILLFLPGCGGAPAVVGSASAGAPAGEAVLSKQLDDLGYSDKVEIKRISNYRLSGWSTVDNYHLIISGGPGKNYLIRLRTSCYGLRRASGIGFKTHLSSVARNDRLIIYSMNDRIGDCWIDSLFELTQKPKAQEATE